ncbi:MAG: cytochrome P450 [Myxococcota bacterium]
MESHAPNQPPVPPKAFRMPVLGSVPSLLLQRYRFLERARERCGNIFRVDLGVGEVTVVGDPILAEEILIRRARHFDKGGEFWEGAREAIGNGLALSEGDLWRRQRRLMNPEFRRERIAGFASTITTTIEQSLPELEPLASGGENTDISLWTSKLLATLTVRILLGSELDEARFVALRDSLGVMLDGILSGVVTRKLPGWVPVPGVARFEAARQTVDEIVLSIIAERRATAGTGHDLLSLLLAAVDDEGGMSDQQLRDEVVLAYTAGYETTAWALAWGLMVLGDEPGLVAELQAELDRQPDLRAIPLLDACVREALRLYPSAPLIPRRALVDEQLGGHRIAAGTQLMVSPWLIHRNPEIWPEPTRFDPYRHVEGTTRPRLSWMPFGAGQRICIGKGLAMMEATTALGMLLRRYTPLPASRRRSEPRLSSTLGSRDGIWLRLAPRAVARTYARARACASVTERSPVRAQSSG